MNKTMMPSTPWNNKNTSPTMSASKTMGWTRALFGTTKKSIKTMGHANDSNTADSDAFEILEGFDAVPSPDFSASKALSVAMNDDTEVPAAALSFLAPQFRPASPSTSSFGTQKWTAISSKNSSIVLTTATTRVVPTVDRSMTRHQNKYRPSRASQFVTKRRSSRAHKISAPPSETTQPDRNVLATSFTKTRICIQAVRLYPLGEVWIHGRLPIPKQLDDYDFRTIVTKKRRVRFVDEKDNISLPTKNLVRTPAKNVGSRPFKRKATPIKWTGVNH